jgi:hypothetical protein
MVFQSSFKTELHKLLIIFKEIVGGGMVFNVTFNNISAISWQLVLLVEETRLSGENHRSAASDKSLTNSIT